MYIYEFENVEYQQFFLGQVMEGLVFFHQGGDFTLIVRGVDRENKRLTVERFN